MAYVRKVRTQSGAIAVQIAQKHQGRLEILQHLGSAHTDAELGILVEQARTALDGDQQTLDLHTPARVQHMSDTADWTGRSAPQQHHPSGERTAPAGHTTGTHSRLLHQAIGAVYDGLGFDVLDDAVFRDLVIARIAEPTSKRAVRDQKTLTQQENRARAVIAGEKHIKGARFVKTTGGGRSLDEASLARARSLVGLKGYVTNMPAHVMPATEVISSYHDLWQVEQSFRMSKTDLRARPVFHHTREAIEAHLTIVFAALAVAREMQRLTGRSVKDLVKRLRPLRSATICINGADQVFPPRVDEFHRRILTELGCREGY